MNFQSAEKWVYPKRACGSLEQKLYILGKNVYLICLWRDLWIQCMNFLCVTFNYFCTIH